VSHLKKKFCYRLLKVQTKIRFPKIFFLRQYVVSCLLENFLKFFDYSTVGNFFKRRNFLKRRGDFAAVFWICENFSKNIKLELKNTPNFEHPRRFFALYVLPKFAKINFEKILSFKNIFFFAAAADG